MLTFKKVLLPIIVFLFLFSSISILVIIPYYNSEVRYYQDGKIRKEMSGTIDYVTVGASHALAGFVPEILDKELGCNSYNLSVSMMPMYAKYVILEKELSRNDIDTVVLEISYDTLNRKNGNEYAIGDEPMIAKFDNWGDRWHYLTKYVAINDWLNIYSRSFIEGLWNWKNILLGNVETVDFSGKGFLAKKTTDVTMSEAAAIQLYASKTYVNNINKDNYNMLIDIIEMCHSNGARVIIAVVPVSNKQIWKISNLDAFLDWGNEFSKQNGCEFYDFNIIRNRNSVFNDAYSYADDDHMSEQGARIFTSIFCEIMKKVEQNEDISSYFYKSYYEMIADSPYFQFIEEKTLQ